MEGIVLMGAIVLVAVLPASLVALSWMSKPRAFRELAKGEIKVKPRVYSKGELEGLKEGNFAIIGEDYHTRQMVVLPEHVRRANLLNIGPSGSGKTYYMLHTLIARDIAAKTNSVVIFDNQGDLIDTVIALCQKAGREYVVLPDAGFNPLGGEGSARDRAETFADLLAQSAETSSEADSRYYIEQSQAFVRAMIPLFERAYSVPMMLQELVYLCKFAPLRERVRKDAGPCPEAEDYALYVATISPSKLDKVTSGLVATIQKLTVGSRIALHNVRDGASLEACLRQGKVVIIREGGTRHSKDRPLGLLYMLRLQHAILAREPFPANPGPFVSIYMDEAYRYFHQEFGEFINTCRKFNAALHLGFQTVEQLRPDINAILGGCGTWVIHGRLLAPDAEMVAENIGRRLFALKSIGQSASSGRGGMSQTETTGYDYLIPPHYIRYLPQDVLLLISLEEREAAAVRTIKKPSRSVLNTAHYHSPPVRPYPPATIWASQNKASFDALIATSVSPQGSRQTPHHEQGRGLKTDGGTPGTASKPIPTPPQTSPSPAPKEGASAPPKTYQRGGSHAPAGPGVSPGTASPGVSPPRTRAKAFDATRTHETQEQEAQDRPDATTKEVD